MFFQNKKTLIQNGLNMTQPQYADLENYKKSVQKQFDKVEEEIKEAGIGVTKISQLENDVGFITKDESTKYGGLNIYEHEGKIPNPDDFIDETTGEVDWEAYEQYVTEFMHNNPIVTFYNYDEVYMHEFWEFIGTCYRNSGICTDADIRTFFEKWVVDQSKDPLTPEEIQEQVDAILAEFPFTSEIIEKLKYYVPDVIDYKLDVDNIYDAIDDVRDKRESLTFLDSLIAPMLDGVCSQLNKRCVNYSSACYWIEKHFKLNHDSTPYRDWTTADMETWMNDAFNYIANDFITDPDYAYLFEDIIIK